MDFNHQSYGDRKFLVAIFLMCHYGFTIYMKKYFKAKENYGNSNILPCKNMIFTKNPLKETKIL